MSDLIDRQAAIDALRLIPCDLGKRELEDAIKAVEQLPSAQPEVLAHGEGELSAQPERKKGKWVEVAVTDGYDKDGIKTWISVMQCDQCGFIVNAVEGHMAQYNYCPNCGAQMMGGQNHESRQRTLFRLHKRVSYNVLQGKTYKGVERQSTNHAFCIVDALTWHRGLQERR